MTAVRRPVEEPFDIHEDARTEETEMMVEDEAQAATEEPQPEDEDEDEEEEEEQEEEEQEEEQEDGEADGDEESSDDERVESSVQADMDKLQHDFPGFRDKYRLIKRIGEGSTLSVPSRSQGGRLTLVSSQAHSRPSSRPRTYTTAATTTAGTLKTTRPSGRPRR